MKMLTLDIGGTYSRFAYFTVDSKNEYQIIDRFEFETTQNHINHFSDLLNHFTNNKPELFPEIQEYDICGIAIAGPVVKRKAYPPNISWILNLEEQPLLPTTYLLNDFAAQAYALLRVDVQSSLIVVHQGNADGDLSAVIGAGTGLGHSLIVNNQPQLIIPSEAGQCAFNFKQYEEKIEQFFLSTLKTDYINNDQVVSGSGLSLLHQYITGTKLTATEILTNKQANEETIKYFSRFYGRASREYCLSTCANRELIISGGIAGKHPEIIRHTAFREEFLNSDTHKALLSTLHIKLNTRPELGMLGMLEYISNIQ